MLINNRKTMIFYRTKNKKICYKKQLLNTGLDPSKKVIHNAGEFIENKIAVNKSNNDKIVKQEPGEEIIILPNKRDEILNKF